MKSFSKASSPLLITESKTEFDSMAAAMRAYIKPGGILEEILVGDVIDSIDGTTVADSVDLRKILFGHHPGDQVSVGYTDALGNSFTVTVTLGSGPPQ